MQVRLAGWILGVSVLVSAAGCDPGEREGESGDERAASFTKEGASCDLVQTDLLCAKGLVCRPTSGSRKEHYCMRPSLADGFCSEDKDCATGLHCGSPVVHVTYSGSYPERNGRCVLGASCSSDSACESGLVCRPSRPGDTPRTCQPLAVMWESCGDGDPIDAHCAGPNGACETDDVGRDVCVQDSGLECNNWTTSCPIGQVCRPGYLSKKVPNVPGNTEVMLRDRCRPPAGNDEVCEEDADCALGLYCRQDTSAPGDGWFSGLCQSW